MTPTPISAVHGAHVHGPHIDWSSLSPIVVLAVGAIVVLAVGLLRSRVARERSVPLLTLATLAGAIGAEIWRFGHPATIIAGALRIDDFSLLISMICAVAAICCVLMSWRSTAPRVSGHGEYHSLLLFSVMGMAVLVAADDIVTLFIGLELLSIPLYILCASEHRRAESLESGLKYLIIGSVGSATLLYGLAMVYGATGQTGFAEISAQISSGAVSVTDPLLLTGIGLTAVGFAFKASVAPFHQWTPDVYEGAPTPITAFMATATKAAALGIFLRMFVIALIAGQEQWAPLLAALAAVTIIVGNVGALSQTSLKRLLAYSGVGQAGYMLGGIVVGTRLGASTMVLYLIFYLLLNMAAFAVIVAVERDRASRAGSGAGFGSGSGSGFDAISGLRGLGRRSPVLASALTVAMLGLAGVPGTVGFVGKFQLIHALVDGNYTWLAVVLVVGAMISLAYYLRVVGAIWIDAADTAVSGEAVVAGGGGGLGGGGGAGVGGAGGVGAPLPAGFSPMAGGSPEADAFDAAGTGPGAMGGASDASGGLVGGSAAIAGDPGDVIADPLDADPEILFVAVLFGFVSVLFGIIPQPMFHLASHAGAALINLL